MSKRNGMAGGMVVSGEEVARLLGGLGRTPEPEKSPEEKTAEAAASYAKCVREASAPCQDAGHERVHKLGVAMMRELFRSQMLPERVREAFLSAYVSLKLHSAESTPEGVAALVTDGGKAFSEAMLLAGVVALACGVPPEAAGAALEISGGSEGRDGRDADLAAGYL